MPKVYNKYHNNAPTDAIYIGRPSKWGNPFSHKDGTLAKFKVETREQAVDAYERWAKENPNLVNDIKKELVGKDLVCFCVPKRCHGDVIIEIANKKVDDK